jgi:hypothetical protein
LYRILKFLAKLLNFTRKRANNILLIFIVDIEIIVHLEIQSKNIL